MPSLFKVTIRNHSHTIRTGRFEVTATRLYITDDLNLQGGVVLKSQTGEFVFCKFKIEESVESKLHVVVLVSST